MRMDFISSLHSAILPHNSSAVLQLRQAWTTDNNDLIHWQRQQFTNTGKELFWCSIEQIVRFADLKMMRGMSLGSPNLTKIFQKEKLKKDMEGRLQLFRLKEQRQMDQMRRNRQREINNIITSVNTVATHNRRVTISYNRPRLAPINNIQQRNDNNREDEQKDESTVRRQLFKY